MHNATWGGWIMTTVLTQAGTEAGSAPVQAPPAAEKTVVPLGAPGAPVTAAPGSPAAPSGGAAPAGSQSMFTMLIPLLLFFVVMIAMTSMSGRKEKKRREQLLSSIKKHDQVQTLGGIIGTVTEINDQEVVLRLEEGRMRVSRGAIQSVIREGRRPNGVIEDKERRAEKVEV